MWTSGSPCEQEESWSYIHDRLLPIHVVWQTKVPYRRVLRRYAAELAENAMMIAYTDGQRQIDSAYHVMEWHITHEIGVHNAFDDEASTIHQSITTGRRLRSPSRSLRCH